MRGEVCGQHGMFSYVSLEDRVRPDHPLRAVKVRTEAALKALNPVFSKMYAAGGRPSIAPERLLKAQLLIALFSVRSDRQFCEQLDFNLLFRWFLDMPIDKASFDPSTFSKNRERLLEHDVARQFFSQVVRQAKEEKLLSAEHFSVDGTLIESLASLKSVRAKDDDHDGPIDPDNTGVDFKGQQRSNATHQSVTDPEAKLYCKGRSSTARGEAVFHRACDERTPARSDCGFRCRGRARRRAHHRACASQPPQVSSPEDSLGGQRLLHAWLHCRPSQARHSPSRGPE
jgi:transposase